MQRDEPPGSEEDGSRLDLITAQGLYLFQLRSSVDRIQAVRSGFLSARRSDEALSASQFVRHRIRNWEEVLSSVAAYVGLF